LIRKGGESPNGSEEKGSEEGDKEKVGTLQGLGGQIDPEKQEMKELD
jgi:hypothetical protein